MHRVGNFFLLVGIIFIILFTLTDSVHTPYLRYLLLGVVSLIIGIGLHLKPSKAPRPISTRFQSVKRKKKPDETQQD